MKLPANYNRIDAHTRRKVRLEYVKLQSGRCHYCNSALSGSPPASVTLRQVDWSKFPAGFLDHPVHLHHDHGSGMTIGAVHSYCNAVLWQYHGQ